MSTAAMADAGALDEAVAARALSPGGDATLDRAVEGLVSAAGDSLQGLVFFGSRRSGAARADAWSAYDVFVIVGSYRRFYEAVRRAGLTGKSPRFMSVVSLWLPPTQFSLRLGADDVHVKAAVIRLDTYLRETSPRRRDHFCIGRLFQPTRVLWARDPEARSRILASLVGAHEETWPWVRPWLPERFDAEAYGHTALQASMSWEIRPEPQGRADALWAAQREEQVPVFAALLASLAVRGDIVPAGGMWMAREPARWPERLRLRLYFGRSLLRATARWLKHTVSFEGWLDYILHKANRHTGEPVQLTERERRWPWIFLWARLVRYLRGRKSVRRLR